MPAPRVTVVGSGPAGTPTAIALSRSGIPTTVYEAYTEPGGTTGSFLTLGMNGLRTLRALGCDSAVLARGFTVSSLHIWTSRGQLLGVVPDRGARDTFTALVILRSHLIGALRAEAERAGASIHTGKWLVGASPTAGGVTGRFADGSSVESDVLVGADGAASRVRRIIDATASTCEQVTGYAVDGVASIPDVSPGALHMVLAERSSLIFAASPAGQVWWSAVVPADDAAAPDGPDEDVCRTRLTELYGDGDTVAGALVAATETLGRPVPLSPPYQVPRWRDGRMVIIGDAAHPIGCGLGASLAIEDGVTLARCLRDADDVQAALAAYEALRRPRIERIIRVLDRYRGLRPGPLGRWMAEKVAPVFLRHFWDRSTSWLLGYNVDS
ncbi:MAG TPA: NAD(P)/FAD-dependent oxidoreductase [Micromonosporaceae bacterium]